MREPTGAGDPLPDPCSSEELSGEPAGQPVPRPGCMANVGHPQPGTVHNITVVAQS